MKKQKNQRLQSLLLAAIFLLGASFSVKAQSDDFRGYRIGRYEGSVLNTTYNVKDKLTFEIKKINRTTGEIIVSIAPSGNLSGAGTLTGKIDESGVLRISGPVSIWTMRVVGRVGSNTIKGDYRLTDSSGSIQEGNFNVSLTAAGDDVDFDSSSKTNPGSNNTRSNEPTRSTGSAADINGAWKGTYTCQQGLTNVVLSLFTKDGTNVEGVFTFLLGDGSELSVLGSAKYKGTYDNKSGKINLKGIDWDQKPSGYNLYDLSGSVSQPGRKMSGSVIGPGCTTFQIEKIKF